jgi:predicted glycosyltransferase
LYGIPHTVIGVHGGASLAGKAANLAERVVALRVLAKSIEPSMALCLNSYSQLIAARTMGLPSVTTMDYEHQPANHLAFRAATWVFVPTAYPDVALRKQGASMRKTWKFPGTKEEIALAGFVADEQLPDRMGLEPDKVIVVVRPPAGFALYHRFENPLFPRLLDLLLQREDVRAVMLARTSEQAAQLSTAGYGKLLWTGDTVDGLSLISCADLVISAGGSMNREAAVLGTPAFSVYAGKPAAIDRALAAKGRLVLVDTEDALESIRFVKRPTHPSEGVGDGLLRAFVAEALERCLS